MPYDVPVENAIGVAQAVYETDSVREMLKNYVAEDEDIEVELPQDVKRWAFRICRPCTSMVN